MVFAVLAILFAACGGNDDTASGPSPSPGEPSPSPGEPSPSPGEPSPSPGEQGELTISIATTDFGPALVDQGGMLLYMFVPDQQENGKPTCYGDCAKAWPALEGEANAGEGVDEGLLGTVERRDGTPQATYNDLPLYYFAGDQSAGDVNGQGLGDVWWIMDASGNPIEAQPTRISLATTELGDILVDGDGMTLYMFVPDQQENGTPTCYDDCERMWPPFEPADSGVFLPGEGVDESLFGTVERKDGTQQVTYNDLPLYLFADDKDAGDVNGQGLGDVWWVMDADGQPIRKTARN
jgi:predicted lipoprotein with Yx(FWY)xxD motif